MSSNRLASGPKWLMCSQTPAFSEAWMAFFISSRSYLWKLSPSMTAARMLSRRKMCSKDFLTVEVPAPEEPVMAMTGCLADMVLPFGDSLNCWAAGRDEARRPTIAGL